MRALGADVLIPVKHLCNGLTIAQEPAASVRYFHVELDRHDVLFAEGLPVESYLDTGNRAQFEGGAAYLALHPDFSRLHWRNACAPLCEDGPIVAAVRRQLLDRLGALGIVEVIAAGTPLRPASASGRVLRYLLPPGAREVIVRTTTGLRIGSAFAAGRPMRLERDAACGDIRLSLAPSSTRVLLDLCVLATRSGGATLAA